MNTVRWLNGSKTPYWELKSNEIVYTMVVTHEGEEWDLYVYMKPPTPQEELAVRMMTLGSEEFVDKHFIKFKGMNPDDPKVHHAYLNNTEGLKKFVYEEGVQGVANIIETEFDSLGNIGEIPVNLITNELFCPKKSDLFRMNISYSFKNLERGVLLYEGMFSGSIGGDTLSIETDFESINTITVECLKSVDGYLIEGKPCVEENRGQWLPLLPFEHRLVAIDEAFKPAQVQ